MENIIENYNTINRSYKKKYIYHFGKETGFFSEYNNMLLAMLYCLKNKIQFVLYSEDANFSVLNGWSDCFLPFSPEKRGLIHQLFNYKFTSSSLKKNPTLLQIYKSIFRIDYTTIDLWNLYRNNDFFSEKFYFPELGIDGDIKHAYNILSQITWRYNESAEEIIWNKIKSLNLPDNYIGFHIRSGDKYTEHSIEPIEKYIDKAQNRTNDKSVFISTDNYEIIEEFKIKYPNWDIYTLSDEKEKGYFHEKFVRNNNIEEKSQHFYELFASIEVLSRANIFVGTFSSNIGMFLGFRMDPSKCFGVDYDNWKII